MYSTQPLNDDELDELDDLLMSQDMPENTMDISMLDGFFAALVLHPDFIMPSEYLRWIWDSEQGEDKPEFSSLAEANRILDLIMRHYNSVLQAIADDRFEPLFYVLPQEDGSEFFDAEGWSCGFILATSIFNEPWEPVFKERPELLTPMVLLGTERGWDMLERSGNNRLATQEAYEAIADAVSLINEHFREQREASTQQRLARTDMKPNERPMPDAGAGRDESCPCGSGRDFSECCGAARTLH